MKSYYLFENKGEVNKDIIKLIGLSTKRDDDTKIGQWGSGLKYAIATFLREGIDIRVFSGDQEVKIGKKKKKIDGHGTVEVITFNGVETSMTTEMGFDWKVWYAIREVYSNMLDEGGKSVTVDDNVEGRKGYTRFFIKMDESTGIDMNKYFLISSSPVDTIKYGREKIEIHTNPYDHFMVYRKGILCFEDKNKKSEYRYSSDSININESRVVIHSWNAYELVGKAFISTDKIAVIDNILDLFTTKKRYSQIEMVESCWDVLSEEMNTKTHKILAGLISSKTFVRERDNSFRSRAHKVDYVIPNEMFALFQSSGLLPEDEEKENTAWIDVKTATPDSTIYKMWEEINDKFFQGKSGTSIATGNESPEYRKVNGVIYANLNEDNQKEIIVNNEFIHMASDAEIKKQILTQMLIHEASSDRLTASFERNLIDRIYSNVYDEL